MHAASVTVLRRLFTEVAATHAAQVPATKRSKEDKEYFIQDWVLQRATDAGLAATAQGRNSYPDFWLADGSVVVGNEVKSLEHMTNGKPARTDLDFNSTSPKPVQDGRDCSLTFALYRKTLANGHLDVTVTTVCVADVAVVNDDATFEHVNASVPNFGSYGDAFIRNRRMYRFNHPVTTAASYGIDLRDKATLILEEGAITAEDAAASGLACLGRIVRKPAVNQLTSYTVDVRTGVITPEYTPIDEVQPHVFDVWTPA